MKLPVDKLKQHSHLFMFLFLTFFYVFYPFKIKHGGITADAVLDAHIVKNIISGGGLGWQATLQPPFQAILASVFYPFSEDILSSGIFVSKFMWWLLPLPVYFLANTLFGRRTALCSAVLVFFHPHFSSASNMMEPTVTYTTLMMAGLCFISLAFFRKNYFHGFMGGLFFACAYLSRSEGFFVFIFVFIYLLAIIAIDRPRVGERFKRISILTLAIVSFLIISIPYLSFLEKTYGKVVLSPKSSYVNIWMKPRVYKEGIKARIYYPATLYSLSIFPSTESGDIALWGLTRDGKLKWQEPSGAGDLISFLTTKPTDKFKIYLANFKKQIPGYIPNNSGQWLYPQTYPWYFVVPALLWFLLSLKKRGEWQKTLFLLSPLTILFILPIFSGGWWKYLLPYSPLFIILAAAGITYIQNKYRWRFLAPVFTIIILLYSVYTVKASPYVKHGNAEVSMRGSILQEQKKAGNWAKMRFKGTPNYMVQWSKLAYYLDGLWTAFPVAETSWMAWYAKQNSVDYIVFETYGRKDIELIINELANSPLLEVADIYRSDTSSYGVVFLRLI